MADKGTKLKIAQKVFGMDFTYENYLGKTEGVSIPIGDFPAYQELFTEAELAQLLNRIIRIDFVNYSNRKPSQKVDAVKVLLATMSEQCVGKTDSEKATWLYENATKSRLQAPAPVEEEDETEE